MDLKNYIISVPDFPKEGIDFKDITPILNNVEAFRYVIDQMAEFIEEIEANVIVSPEARGFLFASAVAYKTGCRFVLVRKPGKLPREVYNIEYSLEYGNNYQEMHKGDIKAGDRVAIIDDILATGGTIEAIIKLIEHEKAFIAGISFLADLTELHGEDLLANYKVQKLVKF